MVKSKENLVGAYAFLVGVVLAIGIGLFNYGLESGTGVPYAILIVVGLVVGAINVGDRNSVKLLFASLSLVIVGNLGRESLRYIPTNNYIATAFSNVLVSLLILFAPVTIVVALKAVFAQSKI